MLPRQLTPSLLALQKAIKLTGYVRLQISQKMASLLSPSL